MRKLALALLLALGGTALAQTVPNQLHFQGRLTDAANNPLTGANAFVFEIFDDPAAGNLLWTETQPAVAVANGVFAVQLGAVTPVASTVFTGSTAYLQVTVNGTPLTPRERLLTAAYAHSSQLLAGREFSAFVSTDAATQNIAGAKTFTGTLSVPAPTLPAHAATKAYVDGVAGAGLLASTNTWSGQNIFLNHVTLSASSMTVRAGNVQNAARFQTEGPGASIAVFRDDVTAGGISQNASIVLGTVNDGTLWTLGSDLEYTGSNDFSLIENPVLGTPTRLVVQAQTGNVGIGSKFPGARLHVASGTVLAEYGLVASTVTLGPLGAAPTGATGMLYYDSTTDKLRLFNGAWVDLATGTIGAPAPHAASHYAGGGDELTGTLAISSITVSPAATAGGLVISTHVLFSQGRLGIGTMAPSQAVHVKGGSPAIYVESTGGGTIAFMQAITGLETRFGSANNAAMTLHANFAERARITTHGAMGVGITAPAGRLHVSSAGASAADNVLLVSSGAAAGQELLVVKGDGKIGVGVASPVASLDVRGGLRSADPANPYLQLSKTDGAAADWYLQYNTNAEAGVELYNGVRSLRYTDAGELGVGTTSPSEALDVVGGAQFGAGALKSTFTATPGLGAYALELSSGVTVGGGGPVNLGAGGFIRFPDGSTQNTAAALGNFVSRTGDTMTGQLTLAGSTLTIQGNAFSVGGSTFAVKGGSVGVGTSNPTDFLTVEHQTWGSEQGLTLQNTMTAGHGSSLRFKHGGNGDWTSRIEASNTNTATADGIIKFSQPVRGASDQAVMTIKGSSVGIGALAPATALDVNGSAQFGAGAAKSTFSAAGVLTFPTGYSPANPLEAATKAYVDGVSGEANTYTSTKTFTSAVGIGSSGLSAGTLVVRSTSATAANPVLNLQANDGSELLRVQQDGKVGIGTDAPLNALDIQGASSRLRIRTGPSVNDQVELGGTANQVMSFNSNAVGTAIQLVSDRTGSGGGADIRLNSIGLYGFTNATNGGTLDTNISRLGAAKLAVGNGTQGDYGGALIAGSIGVGTSAPAALLDVAGNAQFGQGATKSTFSATGALTFPTGYSPANPLEAATKAYVDSQAGPWTVTQGSVTLSAGDKVGVGIIPSARLHVSSAGALATDAVLRVSTGAAAGQDVLIVKGDGKVGLGTDSPQVQLHVAGDSPAIKLDRGGSWHGTISLGNPLTLQVDNGLLQQASNGGWKLQPGGENAPSYSFKNDENTGMYGDNNADFLGFSTDGVERMRVNTVGVGVSTKNPQTTFEVGGSASFGAGATKSTFSATGVLTFPAGYSPVNPLEAATKGYVDGVSGEANTYTSTKTFTSAVGVGASGLTAGTLVVRSTSATAANPILNIQNSGGTEVFRVQGDGKVGIGGTPGGNRLRIVNNENGATNVTIENGDNGAFASAGLQFASFGGAFAIRKQGPFNNGTGADAADYGVITEGGRGLNLVASQTGVGTIKLYTGGTNASNQRFIVDTNGRVGIATGAPTAVLDVQGDASFGSGATKSTFTATPGLGVYALRLSSGATISGGGPLNLETGGFIRFADGTTQNTASGAHPTEVTLSTINAPAATTYGGLVITTNVIVSNGTRDIRFGVSPSADESYRFLSGAGELFLMNGAGDAMFRFQSGRNIQMRSDTSRLIFGGADGDAALTRRASSLLAVTDNNGSALGDMVLRGLTVKSTAAVEGNAFSVGGSTFVVTGGSVAIGAAFPSAMLDVNGNASFGSGATKSTFSATGVLTFPAGYTPANPLEAATKDYVDANAGGGGWTREGTVVKLANAGDAAVVQSTLTVQGNAFSVGASTFVVAYGSVAIGVAAPASNLHVSGGTGLLLSNPGAAGALLPLGDDDFRLQAGSAKLRLANKFGSVTAAIGGAGSMEWEMSGNMSFLAPQTAIRNPANGDFNSFLSAEARDTLQLGTDVNGAPTGQVVKAHDGITGTDVAGSSMTLAAGRGTGAGAPGHLVFQTATPLASGTAAQQLSTRMTITEAGRVGIGTTTPAALLDVAGAAQFGQGATKSTFSTTGVLTFPTGYSPASPLEAATKGYVDANAGGGWTREGTVVKLANAGDAAVIQSTLTIHGGEFSIGSTTFTVASGRVGVGTAAPSFALSVAPTAGSSGATAVFEDKTPATGVTKVLVRGAAGQGGESEFEIRGPGGQTVFAVDSWSDSASANILKSMPGAGLSVSGRFGGVAGASVLVGDVGVRNVTSGAAAQMMLIGGDFTLASGASPLAGLEVAPTVNQTGTATGVSRGVYVNPVLTSAVDFRALDLANASGYGVHQGGSGARNYFAGSVGIGTTTPAALLDVAGNAQFGSGATKSTFSTTGVLTFPTGYSPASPLEAATKGYVDANAGGGWTREGTVVKLANAGDAAVVQSTLTVQGNAFSVGASTLIVSGGHVGIGATDPAFKLNVVGSARVYGNSEALSVNSVGGNTNIAFRNGGGSAVAFVGADVVNDGAALTTSVGGIFVQNTGSGNVGIGTTTPNTLLDVAGSAQFGQGATKSTFSTTGVLTFPTGYSPANPLEAATKGYVDSTAGAWTREGTVVKLANAGDAAVVQSTLTVQGNAFSVGVSTLVVASGRVGIGVLAPSHLLDVSGTGAITSARFTTDSDNVVSIENTSFGSRVALGLNNIGGGGWTLIGNRQDQGGQFIMTSGGINGTRRLTMNTSGDLGIGAGEPAVRLDVGGAAQFGSGASKSTFSTTGALTFPTGYSPASPLEAATKGYVDANGGGWTREGTVVKLANAGDAAVVQSTLTILGNAFSVGGSTFVVKGGSVGIGTNDPSSTLDVQSGNDIKLRVATGDSGDPYGLGFIGTNGRRVTMSSLQGSLQQVLQFGDAGTSYNDTVFGIATTESGWQPRLVMKHGGALGVGTNAPTARLHVSSAAANAVDTLLLVSTGTAANESLLVVKGDGKLGLGNAEPATKLDVAGDAQFGSGASKSTFSTTGVLTFPTGYSPGSPLEAATKGYVDSTAGAWTREGTVVKLANAGDAAVVQSTLTIQGNAFSIGYSTFMVKGGSVGVGTVEPLAQFHVSSSVQVGYNFGSGPRGDLKVYGLESEGRGIWAMFDGFYRTHLFENGIRTYNNTLVLDSDKADFNGISLRVANSEVMRVGSGGHRVGIGTVFPAAKLHVSSSNALASDSVLLISSGTALHQELLAVKGDGKIGVGTSTPSAKLDVIGDAQFGSGASKSTFSANGTLTFPAAYAPSNPQEAATKAYVDGAASGGWTREGTVVKLANAGDAAVIQSTLTIQGSAFSVGDSTFVVKSGSVGIGDSNPQSTLSIYRPAGANPVLSLGDGDVAHGMTSIAATSSFGRAEPLSPTAGGLRVTGLSAGDFGAVELRGLIGSADPANTTPAVKITGARRSGAGAADLDVEETILSVANNDEANALEVRGNSVLVGNSGGLGKLYLVHSPGSGAFLSFAESDFFEGEALQLNYDAVSDQLNFVRKDSALGDRTHMTVNRVNGLVGIGATAPAARLHVSSDNAASGDTVMLVSSGSTSGQELLVIRGDGRIGVGVGAPAARLDVLGNAQFGAGAAKSTFSANGVLTFPTGYAPANPLEAATKGYVDGQASGWTREGTVVKLANSSDAAVIQSTLTIQGNEFSVSGSVLSVKNSKVGVGVADPQSVLDVAGPAGNDVFIIRTLNAAEGGADNQGAVLIRPEQGAGVAAIQGMNNQVDAATPLALNPDGGDVGVGTINPKQTLSINGSAGVWNAGVLSFYTDGGDTQGGLVGAGRNGQLSLVSKTSGGWLRLGSNAGASKIGLWTNGGADVDDLPQVVVDAQGHLGAGTIAPLARLHVSSGAAGSETENILLVSTGSTNLFRVQANGDVFALGALTGGGADLAEMYWASGPLEKGELAMLRPDGKVGRHDGTGRPLGIISTDPGTLLGWTAKAGEEMPDHREVALAGRVPAKVLGKIAVGDDLAPAGRPGWMRKAKSGELTVGIALEASAADEGKVLAFVSLGDRGLQQKVQEQAHELEDLRRRLMRLEKMMGGGR